MVRLRDILDNGLKYNDGDDTGLAIPRALKKMGKHCVGYGATRCPKSSSNDFQAEFNRYVGLVFGDKVYHHGGYTRVAIMDDDTVMRDEFGWALDRVIEESGAEFLLDDGESYRFQFDREEEVHEEKMDRIFGFGKLFETKRSNLPPDPGYVSGKKTIGG